MKLSDVCIKRPVLATVLSLVIVLLVHGAWLAFPVRFAQIHFFRPDQGLDVRQVDICRRDTAYRCIRRNHLVLGLFAGKNVGKMVVELG